MGLSHGFRTPRREQQVSLHHTVLTPPGLPYASIQPRPPGGSIPQEIAADLVDIAVAPSLLYRLPGFKCMARLSGTHDLSRREKLC